MNCIFLLLLLSCCGGFGCSGNGSGRDFDGRNTSPSWDDGCGCSGTSSLGNGNSIGNGFPTVGSGYDYQEASTRSGNDCGCGENAQGTRDASDGNPSHWQDFPGIPRRENCDCDN